MAAPNTAKSIEGGWNLHFALCQICWRLTGVDIDLSARALLPPDDTRHKILAADVQDRSAMRDAIGREHYELIVAGELLEHLANPGLCLTTLAEFLPDATLIVSAPNAFSAVAAVAADAGDELVHENHVCWYSPRTLRRLLEVCGWTHTTLYACGQPGGDYGPGNLTCPSILAASRRQ